VAAAAAFGACVAAAPAAGATDGREVTAVRVSSPPTIDGRLDDACWAEAVPTSDFRNFRADLAPATQQTVVRICYDSSTLYVGIDCLEDDVEDISAAIAQRDADEIPEEDDCVSIALDTFRDRRSSYAFLVSALGTKRDVHASECGRSRDAGWDAVWDAGVAIHSDRWTAEMAIPFSALRWADADTMVWGVDFARVEMPHREYSLWNGTQGSFMDPTGFGTLRGLEGIERSAGIEILPYFLGEYDTSGRFDYPLEPDDADWDLHGDAGLDIEYAPTAYATVNLTVNPDFAQIEADPNQINLSGDEIRLEERRPFFSESADLFSMPLRLLYTRRMEDIVAGGKVTGKAGAASFAGLYVRSNDTPRDEFGFPLTDGSGVELPPEQADYGAIAYRQDLFGSATAGAYLAAREREDGSSRVGALLAGVSPAQCLRLNALAAQSRDSGPLGRDEAYALQWSYDSPTTNSEGTLRYIGEDFAPAMGYVDADARGAYGGQGHLWRRFDTDMAALDELELCGWAGRFEASGGPVQSWWAGGEAVFHLPVGCALGVEYNRSYDVRDDAERPDASLLELYLYTGVTSWSGVVAAVEFGDYHASSLLNTHLGFRYQPMPKLTIETDVRGVALREREDLDWWVGEVHANYLISTESFVRALVLGERVRETVSDARAEEENERYDLGLLWGWEFSPGSMLYLAYNQTRELGGARNELHDPVVVLKVSHLLSL
jgi:hypothetical protein